MSIPFLLLLSVFGLCVYLFYYCGRLFFLFLFFLVTVDAVIF